MAVACGEAHTLALGERGCRVFACGTNIHGQLGAGTRKHQRTPAPVAGLEGLPDVVMVAAGYGRSAAMTSTGALLLWGYNSDGQLGQGDRTSRLVPVTLGPPQFGGAPVAMVACGGHHTLVVARAGGLFAFGCGYDGRLGLGDQNGRDVPVEVGPGRLGGAIIVFAAAGSAHSGVVTSGGGVWTWGCGEYGRLGHNDEQEQLVPRELEGQFGGARARSLAAGDAHTMVHFILFLEAAQDRNRVFNRWFRHKYRLETPRQSCVLFNMLAVFIQCCCANTMQFTARQGGLQQIGCIHCTIRLARAHERVHLIDEQDDLT